MKSSQSLACLFALSLGVAAASLAEGQATPAAPTSPATGNAADPDARERDYFTDVELVTQDGESVRFFTDVLKDHVVLINFIFTNCGSACPLLTRSLASVADLLGDDMGKSVRFISISVDPERDDPAAAASALISGERFTRWSAPFGAALQSDRTLWKRLEIS
jgi:cytochrome oxidase Cu insertion factor (SCO1/SenC/PrrC family)